MGEGEKGIKRIVGNKVATLFGLSAIFDDPHRLLKEIGLSSSKVYKRVPYQCYICGHKRFSNLSLLGVYKKPVFYECEECDYFYTEITDYNNMKQPKDITDE